MISEFLLRKASRELVAVLVASFTETASLVWQDFVDGLIAIAKAAPFPVAMLDAALRMTTRMTGRLVTAPIAGLEGRLIQYLRNVGLHNRVMRVDDAVRLAFQGPKSFTNFITMTGETGLLETILTATGRAMYRGFRSVRWLLKLFKLKNESEFVQMIVSKWMQRATTFFWVALVFLIYLLFAWEAAWLTAIFFGFGFLSGDSQKLILPQDSERKWKTRGMVARVNKRKGPDK